MSETEGPESIERKIEVVDAWIARMATGEVGDVDKGVLKDVLTYYGADFDFHDNPERAAKIDNLIFYSSKSKASGIKEVWGERHENYKQWTAQIVEQYANTGKPLPGLTGDPDANMEGIRQFLYEMTAYAAGAIEMADYQEIAQVRITNGRSAEKSKVKVWAVKDRSGQVPSMGWMKIRPASVPPDFPQMAWEFIKDIGATKDK